MPLHARELGNIAIQTVSGVTQTFTTNLDALDLSRLKCLELELAVTAAASTASDTLDVKIQDTRNAGTTWNTRGRFTAVLGNQTASATTPYARHMVISSAVDLQSGEREYLATGSQGGTELAAGTVLNGLFPPRWRDALGAHAAWRVIAIQTNASGSALFTATVYILGMEWDT